MAQDTISLSLESRKVLGKAVKHLRKLKQTRALHDIEHRKRVKAREKQIKLMELREKHKDLQLTDEDLLNELNSDSEEEKDKEHDSDSEDDSVDGMDEFVNNAFEPINIFSGNLTNMLQSDTTVSLHEQLMNKKVELEAESMYVDSLKATSGSTAHLNIPT